MSNADDAATNFGIIARHTTELLIAMSLEITRRVAGCVSDQEIMVRAVEDITKDNVDKQLMSLAYVKWARSQFPIIKVGHKLAAALMTSRFDVDLEVKHPWDCFMIDVPDGLIDTVGVLGNSVVIKKIMAFHIDRAVTARGGSWAYVAFASDLTALWRYGYTASGMTQTIEERDDADFFVRMDCIDLKVADLIGRLVIGVACMITNAREGLDGSVSLTPVRRKPEKHPKRGAMAGVLENARPLVLRLDAPVKLDLRPRVRQYLGGSGIRLEVRSVVRGHWKNQPYGEGRKLRKMAWIEPYERGPEGAPRLVQPRILDV